MIRGSPYLGASVIKFMGMWTYLEEREKENLLRIIAITVCT